MTAFDPARVNQIGVVNQTPHHDVSKINSCTEENAVEELVDEVAEEVAEVLVLEEVRFVFQKYHF